MKHFMQPQTVILRKAHSTDPKSSSSLNSAKPRPYRKAKSAKENVPPSDPNSMAYDSKQSPATAVKLKSQLPPRPPSSNPLNRKLIMETVPENSVPGAFDSGVQVWILCVWLLRKRNSTMGQRCLTLKSLSNLNSTSRVGVLNI
ncbi:Kinesin-like protein KIN12B [Fagus crenata]